MCLTGRRDSRTLAKYAECCVDNMARKVLGRVRLRERMSPRGGLGSAVLGTPERKAG